MVTSGCCATKNRTIDIGLYAETSNGVIGVVTRGCCATKNRTIDTTATIKTRHAILYTVVLRSPPYRSLSGKLIM